MKTTSGRTGSCLFAIVTLVFVQTVLVGNCLAIQNRASEPKQGKEMAEEIKLPKDPEIVVFQLAFTGGYRMGTPAGFEPTPRLRVYADGLVVTGQNRPEQEIFKMQLDDKNLHSFLNEVVNGHDVFSLNDDKIRKAIEDTGRPIAIVDVPVTEINIRLANRKHSISVYAASFCAGAYPEVEALQRFSKIEKMAQRLAALAQLGGQEVLDAMIELGNAEMAKTRFAERKLGEDNLESSRKTGENTGEARFVIRFREEQKTAESLLTVIVEYSTATRTGKITTYLSSAHE